MPLLLRWEGASIAAYRRVRVVATNALTLWISVASRPLSILGVWGCAWEDAAPGQLERVACTAQTEPGITNTPQPGDQGKVASDNQGQKSLLQVPSPCINTGTHLPLPTTNTHRQ
ncbi:hypothetical protein P171DRAFT_62734 [Karstenula rhodostoma CBS 690.94]|uniref:Uncharacterized protein n=1 Tax=Karstenula rhodostoma CBS 690.94 TaxID=1392251 RepID=A0A9P4PBW6_9PLEO|nr:hypothetical protein P171DRAFT_62734 [Karstenula rhodostoma CBS 690.94]